MVADERGREHIVFHFGDAWSSRHTRRDAWGDRAAWLEWTDARPEPAATWRESDYDPRRRPWYQGAVGARSAASTEARPADRVYWTEPYTFYTARAPGMTAAMAFRGRDGLLRVVGVDLLLTDISAFTTGLRVGEHGAVMVLTDERRVIGLPRDRDTGMPDGQALLKRRRSTCAWWPTARAPSGRGRRATRPDAPVSGGAWWAESSPSRSASRAADDRGHGAGVDLLGTRSSRVASWLSCSSGLLRRWSARWSRGATADPSKYR
jgi:hypothetical protein